MAWTAPKTWIGGEVPTAALLNAQLRDNMNETMAGKATAEGQIFVANGTNSIVARTPDAARVTTSETTTSTSYTNLATVGPEVTVSHGVYAIVFWSCAVSNSVADADSYMSWSMSGSNTREGGTAYSIRQDGVPASQTWRVGSVDVLTTLTPGTTTFRARYNVNAGTGTFADRFIGVIPL